jgi:hypothetical protein
MLQVMMIYSMQVSASEPVFDLVRIILEEPKFRYKFERTE